MPYHVCDLDQPFFSKNKEFIFPRDDYYSQATTGYHLNYLIQKYEPTSLSYPQWIAEKEFLKGGESVVQLGSFTQYFSKSVLKHLNQFKQVHVIGKTKESSLKIKAGLRNAFPFVSFPNCLKFEMEDQSVDIVHTITCQAYDEGIREYPLPEIIRVLNSKGVFYLTAIVEDYDRAIQQLCQEFDLSYLVKPNEQIHFEKTKLYFSKRFSFIEVEQFTSEIRITDVEDLIVYILSDPKYTQLKLFIARLGLSGFRRFLESKMEADGAIILKRQINLLICRKAAFVIEH